MIADVAFTLHQPIPVLEAMELDDLMAWHAQAFRINKLLQGSEGPT